MTLARSVALVLLFTMAGCAAGSPMSQPVAKVASDEQPKATAAAAVLPSFSLRDLGPIHEAVAAAQDGRWRAIGHRRSPDGDALLLETTLHPDPHRSWAKVRVVAADLSRAQVHAVAGRFEPRGPVPRGKLNVRAGTVPRAHHDRLLAAFTGGQKTAMGGYGMMVDGTVLSPPRGESCVVAAYDDPRRLAIAPWRSVQPHAEQLSWWRQTPVCLFVQREPNGTIGAADGPYSHGSVGSSAVISRAAIGLDQAGRVLFVALGTHTTLPALALALSHVGVASAAPLDLGHNRVKFVTYEATTGPPGLRAVPLANQAGCAEDEYIGRPALRDFFYFTWRASAAGSRRP